MIKHNSPCRRQNSALAAVVDLGIAYQDAHGYPQAKVFLMEQAVTPEIIRRVLVHPECRRAPSHPPSR